MNIKGFENWLREREASENTVKTYINAIKQYNNAYNKYDKQSLLQYKEDLKNNFKPSTVNISIVALNNYADFVNKPEYKLRIVKNHSDSHIENVITFEEYLDFVHQLKRDKHYKVYYMVKFMAVTGCRVSELIKLTKSCLITGEAVMFTKGKMRRIFIPDKLIQECKDYFDKYDSKYLFCNKNGNSITTNNVYKQIMYYADQYGMRKNVMHPHSFRHMFAIQFLKSNNNLSLLKDIMGHESINTTAIYLRLSLEEQREEFNKSVSWA